MNLGQCDLGLRIKLRRGIKLCKLLDRFSAEVNKVNYIVNYKFLTGHVRIFGWDDSSMPDGTVAPYTQSFGSKTLPASLLPTASFTMAPRSSCSSSFNQSELGNTALGRMDLVSGLLALGELVFHSLYWVPKMGKMRERA